MPKADEKKNQDTDFLGLNLAYMSWNQPTNWVETSSEITFFQIKQPCPFMHDKNIHPTLTRKINATLKKSYRKINKKNVADLKKKIRTRKEG